MQQALVAREQFPILQTKNYLASHSLGAMPAGTRHELERYADLWASQGILAWDGEWWQVIGEFGQRLERILGASAGTIVPCLNVTLGFATIASCLRYTPERRRIVLCDLEFTTTLPFWLSQEVNGAEVVILPSPDPVLMPVELMEEAIDERTALVVTSYAYFRSGALQQVERLQARAREMGALLVVDAYQAAGCVPIDVSVSDFDFFVGGCHKWLCGGPGGGFLYVRPGLISELQPSLVGWFSLANPFAYEKTRNPELNEGIMRFLNGTPNVPALFAARQGLEWVEKLGLQAIREHSWQLTGWLYDRLQGLGLEVKSPRQKERRNGMVCVDFPGARQAQAELQKQGIILDYRPDCGIRVSPHFYNQLSDLEAFLEALTPLV
ncbi:MAG: aminotransferase class V-fold PLP-dependent enzyme [Vulcanimicrobiota bacterium]